MKKWLKFFCLSFFLDKRSKEGAKRGYANVFLGLLLSFVFLWVGYVGGEMLPFGAHYNASTDFRATVRTVFAHSDLDKRVLVEVEGDTIRMKKSGGEYTDSLLINTIENEADRQIYSVNGYNIVLDSRPADALAEVRAYCVSNDGKNNVLSYEDYLTLNEVVRLNYDFKLEYTGRELVLDDELVENYRIYLFGLSDQIKQEVDKFSTELAEGKITKTEYNRSIYQLYFTNYYPEIEDYESSSKVPLLRNYYYHQYIKQDFDKYLFVFDDYMVGSFETKSGIKQSFYGFYSNLDDGVLVADGAGQGEANSSVDAFVKKSYNSTAILSLYAYAMNVMSLIPFIALMPLVVTLLAYSILRLRGVDSVKSFGSMFKIIGSYIWFSGVIAAVLTIIAAFFVQRNLITALPLVIFFLTLAVRSIIFVIRDAGSYKKQSELEEMAQTEV